MQERSIHDNRVVAYEVDGEAKRIVLHTRFEDRQLVESTDVIFEGVLAYHLENDNFGNILFGISEVPIADLVQGQRRLFEEGFRYAWPGPWNQSLESSLAHLQASGAKAFEISSSYGLAGWVIAASCRLEPTAGQRA